MILRLSSANTISMKKVMPRARANAASGGPMSETTVLSGLRIRRAFSSASPLTVPQHGIVVPQHTLKFLLLVINHLIGSEAPHQFHVTRARGRPHLCSEVFR